MLVGWLTREAVSTSSERPGLAGYLSVLFAAALFGSVFTVAKIPLSSVDPLALSALVYTISGLALIPFAKGSFRMGSKKDYGILLLITGLGAVGAPVLLLYGLQQTDASDASILTNGEVIFTVSPVARITAELEGIVDAGISGDIEVPAGRIECVIPAFRDSIEALGTVAGDVSVTLQGGASFVAFLAG